MIKDIKEEERKEKERANEILAANLYEINIKRKILNLFEKNYYNYLKKQKETSEKINNKRNLYLKKLFWKNLNLYLEIEKDKMFIIKYNVQENKKVFKFFFSLKNNIEKISKCFYERIESINGRIKR